MCSFILSEHRSSLRTPKAPCCDRVAVTHWRPPQYPQKLGPFCLPSRSLSGQLSKEFREQNPLLLFSVQEVRRFSTAILYLWTTWGRDLGPRSSGTDWLASTLLRTGTPWGRLVKSIWKSTWLRSLLGPRGCPRHTYFLCASSIHVPKIAGTFWMQACSLKHSWSSSTARLWGSQTWHPLGPWDFTSKYWLWSANTSLSVKYCYCFLQWENCG